MVFSSLYFLLYFLPAFLVFYYLAPSNYRNTVALIASIFFYAWGEPSFVFLILTSLIIDFYLVQIIDLVPKIQKKKWMWVAVLGNVLILLIAKYLNFFVENINDLISLFNIKEIDYKNIALPIGISFITFQKISYILDCYQGRSKPLKNIVDYSLYILFFPQLIAGPIVRFNEIAAQLKDRSSNDTIDHKLNGLFRFIIGLSKKVLIANSLGLIVDAIFTLPIESINTATAWLGIIAYSFQIYFDFSGYSDMAIGLALMLGFKFPENFNFPYISQSITEFWRRWHITLSNWMRDYLYIPLGGNRVSTTRLYINLSTVFLISGLWHGAAWTFIFWGAFHGLFLILDRLFLINFLKRIGKIPAMLLTYLIVLLGWVFFRAIDFEFAFQFIGKLFSFDGNQLGVFTDMRFWWSMGIAIFFSFSGIIKGIEQQVNKVYKHYTSVAQSFAKAAITLFLGALCILDIYASGFNPFIYFQF